MDKNLRVTFLAHRVDTQLYTKAVYILHTIRFSS